MEELFGIVLQFAGEFLLQMLLEILFELGLRSVREPFRREPNAWFASVGYVVLGATAGAISLAVWPRLMIGSAFGRIVYLGLMPVAAGIAMAAIGAWRRGRDEDLIRLDRFAYGYLFAIAMALVRYAFGR